MALKSTAAHRHSRPARVRSSQQIFLPLGLSHSPSHTLSPLSAPLTDVFCSALQLPLSLPPSAPPVPSHSLSLPLSLPRLSVTSGGSLGHVEHFITVTLALLTHRQTLCLHSYSPTPPMLSCTKSAFLD